MLLCMQFYYTKHMDSCFAFTVWVKNPTRHFREKDKPKYFFDTFFHFHLKYRKSWNVLSGKLCLCFNMLHPDVHLMPLMSQDDGMPHTLFTGKEEEEDENQFSQSQSTNVISLHVIRKSTKEGGKIPQKTLIRQCGMLNTVWSGLNMPPTRQKII